MEQKKQAPAVQGEHAGAIQTHKDRQIPRGYHQQRVLNLRSDGIPRSVADISAALRLSDPRSVIRGLRARGIIVSDEWHKSEHGGRFKRYFIRKGGVR